MGYGGITNAAAHLSRMIHQTIMDITINFLMQINDSCIYRKLNNFFQKGLWFSLLISAVFLSAMSFVLLIFIPQQGQLSLCVHTLTQIHIVKH